MLSEYEERLVRRRMEVRQLQEQRDKLLVTQRKLQQLQQNIRENVSVALFYALGYIFHTPCLLCVCVCVCCVCVGGISIAERECSLYCERKVCQWSY